MFRLVIFALAGLLTAGPVDAQPMVPAAAPQPNLEEADALVAVIRQPNGREFTFRERRDPDCRRLLNAVRGGQRVYRPGGLVVRVACFGHDGMVRHSRSIIRRWF